MIKFNKNQIESLENVKNREELCEKIYAYILSHKDSFKEYQVDYEHLKLNIYASFDLLISQLLTDNEVISQLIVWNTILRKGILLDNDVQQFIYGSNLKARDLLSTLEFHELREH